MDVDSLIDLPGDSGIRIPFSEVGQRLQPCGLVNRTGNRSWLLTFAAEKWLQSREDAYLISVLHAHIRFVGELLHEARDGITQSDLLQVAREKYDCSWSTLDQIRRRTAWLRSSGMAELDFNHKIAPTSAGLAMLEHLELARPGNFRSRKSVQAGTQQDVLPEAHLLVRELLANVDLADRKHNIGYIPRTDGDTFTSIRKFVSAMNDRVSREEIDEFASSEFGLRPSSTAAALSAFKNAGLMEQVGFSLYQSTDIGKACLEASHDVDLLRVIHSKFSFVGEMLEALEEADTPRDLATIGRKRYGLPREDIAEVRTRLQMLRKCGLVEEVAWGRYHLLPLGRSLRMELPTAGPGDTQERDEVSSDAAVDETSDRFAELVGELKEAALDSAKPGRFEKAVAEAFSFLGFESQLFGGSGKTDVLISANLSGGMKYSAVVDAKSSASGKIAETQINFDTLKEHRADNAAEYALVIGPSFPSARMTERANSHKVGLFEVEALVELLRQHRMAPLSLPSLRELVQGSGFIGLCNTEKAWAREKRLHKLCDRVVRQLEAEARNADEVTTGALSPHDLYLILRSEAEEAPTPEEIGSVLSFLSSPLVHAVKQVGQKYMLLEAPRITAMRLRVLAANFTIGDAE
ncbi:restriction endonuclease [Streptomyces sp. NBC_00400]|uniref:restriction endonuclease n=1 Tax=Streptomyces sp. NBC_00400 TaxID=2975737 RepID=UPI002E21D3D8